MKDKAYTGEVEGGINLLGNQFNYKGPMLWMAYLFHDAKNTPETIVSAMNSAIEPLRTKPVSQADLDRALVKLRSSLYDSLDQFNGFGRADLLASFALFDDNPNRINSLETEFRKVTPQLVMTTAQEYLRPENRTVLVVQTKEQAAAEEKESGSKGGK